MKVRDAFARLECNVLPPLEMQKKTLEAWLRANVEGELEKDKGFAFGRLAVMAGEMEDGNTLSGVIIRLCDSEDEAREEVEA